MTDSDIVAPLIFETSWEVCSQAGGIYTVLRTKCAAGAEAADDAYWLIGPYREAAARIEFDVEPAPSPIAEAVEELRQRGVALHTGRWIISHRPRTILIEVQSVMSHLRDMKYFLWHDLGVATPSHDPDADDCIAFGYVVADLLGALQRRLPAGRSMLGHFHEWQGAVAVPLIRHRKLPIPTVFTTHATLVGRSLSAAQVDLYTDLERFDPEAVAFEHGIGHRFQLERAAAQAADVFSTVSEITAQEAERFLGRRADVVLPNGLNVERFTAPHEFQNLHRQYKEQIHEFVTGHFFPTYSFDLDRTLYIFNAGRYEYRNKGIDVFIDAVAELNRRLKAEAVPVTVVAFIVAPAPSRGLNVETLNRQAMLNELQTTCEDVQETMGRRLFRSLTDGVLPDLNTLMDEYSRIRLQRLIHAWRRTDPPPIVTHEMFHDISDEILAHVRRVELLNAGADPVKVVFHPEFIKETSPSLGIDYDQFVRGCNLGVFPSYYEPWGYTPMECIVRGVPAVTSDLAGFGTFLMSRFPEHDLNGMYVARRRGVSPRNVVYQVAGWMHNLCRMSLRERIYLRNRVESHAEHFDWSNMARYYRAARQMALKRHYPDQVIPALED